MAIIFLLSVAVFHKSVINDFVWDSTSVIVHDVRTNSFRDALKFFYEPYTQTDRSPSGIVNGVTSVAYYRPLIGWIHTVEKTMFGINPLPYKTVNILLNAIVTALAFALILALTRNRKLAFAAAAIYACNPTKTEVVYWVYSDTHIISAICILSATLLHAKKRKMLALVCFSLALLSNEQAIMIPAIIFTYDLIFNDFKYKRALRNAPPYFAVLGFYFLIRHLAVGALPTNSLTIGQRLIAAAIIVKRQLKIFFRTDADVTAYALDKTLLSGINNELVIALTVIALLGLLALILFRHKKTVPLFFLALFLLFDLPFLNTGALGDYFMAEKSLYLPGIGISTLIATMFISLANYRHLRHVSVAAIGALCFFHASDAYARADHWKNTSIYLESALEHTPNFAFFRYSLAVAYCEEQRHDTAISMLTSYLKKDPSNYFYTMGLVESYFSLGNTLAERGNYDNAATAYFKSLKYNKLQPRVYNNLGNISLIKKDYISATTYYQQAIALDPKYPITYYNLAIAYEGLKNEVDAYTYMQIYRKLLAGDKSDQQQ